MDGSPTQLIGRSHDVAALTAALATAAGGHGQLVVIEGEAGIGKTRLVAELMAAAGDGVARLVGRADELAQLEPFAAFVDALELDQATPPAWSSDVAELWHSAGTESSEYERLTSGGSEIRIREAIVAALGRRCDEVVAILVVEDAQWADPATVACLARIGRAVGRLRLLVVMTARPRPRSDRLAAMLAEAGERETTPWIELAPLDVGDTVELAAAVAGAPVGDTLRAELGRVDGNPLLTVELIRALDRTGALHPVGDGVVDVSGGDGIAVAGASERVMLQLLALDTATLELLRMAAVIGSVFSVEDLALLSGRPAADLAPAVQRALDGGALVERDQHLAFRHDLIRDALYADQSPSVRRALHRDVARALLSAGRSPARVAPHLVRGGSKGDREAMRWLHGAARSVGSRAPDIAVDLLDQAIALADAGEPELDRIRADRAISLTWAGRAAEGEAACREVLRDGLDPKRAAFLRGMLLRSMLSRGRVRDAVLPLQAAMASPSADAAQQSLYRAAASFVELNRGDVDTASDLADEAMTMAQTTGDPYTESEATHAKARVLATAGRLREAADLSLRALATLEGAGIPFGGTQNLHGTTGLTLISSGRSEEGRTALVDGLRLNENLGAAHGVALHRVMLGDGLYQLGEWDAAIESIESSIDMVSDGPAWPVSSNGVLALIAFHRDRLRLSRRQATAALAARADGEALARVHRALLADALLVEASGPLDAAAPAFRAAWEEVVAMGFGDAHPTLGPEVVRRLVDVDRTYATKVAAAVGAVAEANSGVATIEAAAMVCQGLLAGASDLLIAAVARHREGHQPLELALACEDAAGALRRERFDDDASRLLAEAAAIHQRLHATRDLARVQAAQRALGRRTGATGPRRRGSHGWSALTRTERAVATLVGERLSNAEIADRLFVSRRTVETHISHLLTKLQMPSRSEIIAAIERAGGLVPEH